MNLRSIFRKLTWGAALVVTAPAWISAQGSELYSSLRGLPDLMSGDYHLSYFNRPLTIVNQSYFNRPLTIVNRGHYPIISVKVDGREQLASGYHLPVGGSLQAWVSLFANHTVEATYGTPALNAYGVPFQPLFIMRIPGALAGTTVAIQDWTAAEALAGGVWHGQYLANGQWVDSSFSFQTNGTFSWTLQYGGRSPITATGTYSGGLVNTYGIFRNIDVTTSAGERDSLVLLEYERILNVWISDGGVSRWVTHSQ